MFGSYLNLQQVSLAIILFQALGVEAPGLHPVRADEFPEFGRDLFVSEDRIRIDQIHPDP